MTLAKFGHLLEVNNFVATTMFVTNGWRTAMMLFVTVTPNIDAPNPTPSSLVPLRRIATVRCAIDHDCAPAGSTCDDKG